MKAENSSFARAAKLGREIEAKPRINPHSELRSPEGSNAVQAVNSYDARERSSQNHEADGALKHSHAQVKDSSRIKARPEITADDRANGVPIPHSGHGVHSEPSTGDDGSAGWKSKYQHTNASVKNYKVNDDEQEPSLKSSRKKGL
jgi:hypothetical protein